jgi:hypothetical protein
MAEEEGWSLGGSPTGRCCRQEGPQRGVVRDEGVDSVKGVGPRVRMGFETGCGRMTWEGRNAWAWQPTAAGKEEGGRGEIPPS